VQTFSATMSHKNVVRLISNLLVAKVSDNRLHHGQGIVLTGREQTGVRTCDQISNEIIFVHPDEIPSENPVGLIVSDSCCGRDTDEVNLD
jgi:hypothetical protein